MGLFFPSGTTETSMSTNKKKTRKLRGHVSHGHGRIGKHRKHSGGRGNAGGQHHHRINFDKYHPGYFGKVGMRYYRKTQQKFTCPVLNLDRVWSLHGKSSCEFSVLNSSTMPVVDVTKYRYRKVLGKGHIPSHPLVVKTNFISKIAEKKIKAAGGKIVLTA